MDTELESTPAPVPTYTLNDILRQSHDQRPESVDLIKRAYAFAEKAHRTQKRLSGEPHLAHLAATAYYLAEIGMDAETIAAGLLHDTIEDTDVTDEQLEAAFGKEITFLVQGVTKLGTFKYQGLKQHAESLRRLLVATAQDVRVIVIKLYDRLHNMRTNAFHEPARRRRKALETLEIYAPIADRLGMGAMKRELEDLAFPYVDPDAYQHAVEVRKLKSKETEKGLTRVQKDLQHALARNGVTDFRTEIRIKGLWSLHKKLERKGDDITLIHDIAALRVIVQTVEDCYKALGIIHAMWRPLPGGFKDYIALPKPNNGYQSIHTNVLTSDAGIVEIQIRTEEMHRRAQFGIASHMSYKQLGKTAEKGAFEKLSFAWVRDLIPTLLKVSEKRKNPPSTSGPNDVAPRWLAELADAHAEPTGQEEFTRGLQEDFFSYRLFVFTPKGDVIDLPQGSTPVDFAYAIHSDVGNHMNGAKVSGKLVTFETPLRNGDIVEILTRESARPTAKWLDFARTSLARRHIRATLADAGQPSARPHVSTGPAPRRPRSKPAGKSKKKG